MEVWNFLALVHQMKVIKSHLHNSSYRRKVVQVQRWWRSMQRRIALFHTRLQNKWLDAEKLLAAPVYAPCRPPPHPPAPPPHLICLPAYQHLPLHPLSP